MTLARKWSRSITVDGVEFRWKVRGRPTYAQGLGWSPVFFVAELAEGAGAKLLVELPAAHPSNWVGLPGAAVRPGFVSSSIRSALLNGWVPGRPGPVFLARADYPVEAPATRIY
jgi:hypothetical protein